MLGTRVRGLSTREVADKLNVDIKTVSKWCVRGHIWPAKRIGKYWIIGDPFFLERDSHITPDAISKPKREKVPGRQRGRPFGAKDSMQRKKRKDNQWALFWERKRQEQEASGKE